VAVHETDTQRGGDQQHRNDAGHVEAAAQVAAAQVAVNVVGHIPVFDLFGAMPAQQVQHHRVGAGLVERRGIENPVAEVAEEVLQRRDDAQLLAQPEAALAAPGQAPWPVAQQLGERPVQYPGEGLGIDAVALVVVGQHAAMRARMQGFLAQKTFGIVAQLHSGDVGQHLVVDPAEPQLAGREHQVQRVHHMGAGRVTGHPLDRGVAEVEAHVARQDAVVVVQRCGGRLGGGKVGHDKVLGQGHWNEGCGASDHLDAGDAARQPGQEAQGEAGTMRFQTHHHLRLVLRMARTIARATVSGCRPRIL